MTGSNKEGNTATGSYLQLHVRPITPSLPLSQHHLLPHFSLSPIINVFSISHFIRILYCVDVLCVLVLPIRTLFVYIMTLCTLLVATWWSHVTSQHLPAVHHHPLATLLSAPADPTCCSSLWLDHICHYLTINCYPGHYSAKHFDPSSISFCQSLCSVNHFAPPITSSVNHCVPPITSW